MTAPLPFKATWMISHKRYIPQKRPQTPNALSTTLSSNSTQKHKTTYSMYDESTNESDSTRKTPLRRKRKRQEKRNDKTVINSTTAYSSPHRLQSRHPSHRKSVKSGKKRMERKQIHKTTENINGRRNPTNSRTRPKRV